MVPGRRAVAFGVHHASEHLISVHCDREPEALNLTLPSHVQVDRTDKAALTRMAGKGVSHGGVVARFDPPPVRPLNDLDPDIVEARGPILCLDGVTDPRNLGAIMRSALWFGVPMMIGPTRRTAPRSGAAAKASAGAICRMPLLRVPNLARALDGLKKQGFWIYAAGVSETAMTLREAPLNYPSVLIMGDEGIGIRPNVMKRADVVVAVPGEQMPEFDSLNVSVSTGIILSHFLRE